MSMNDLHSGLALIQEYEDEAEFSGPKSEELIALAESALELKFPPTYRTFFQRLGCGDIAGFEVFGLIGPNFEAGTIPNGIWLTLDERNSAGLPSYLILVADTGYGGYYAIDTSRSSTDGESPVVEWRSDSSESADSLPVAAEDFGVFFRKRLEEMLAE